MPKLSSSDYLRLFAVLNAICALVLMLLMGNQLVSIYWLGAYALLVWLSYVWLQRHLSRPLSQLAKLSHNDPTGRKILQFNATGLCTEAEELYNNINNLYQQLSQRIEHSLGSTERLDQLSSRLSALTDHVSLSLITISTKGIIEEINAATPQMFNLTNEQLIGKKIIDILPRLNIKGGLFQQIVNQGIEIEIDAYCSDKIKPVELSCVELNPTRQQRQYILILHDISQRKNYEDRLRRLNQKLIDTSRQAGIAEIATSILHNVGNVLTSVNTSVGVLRKNAENNPIEGLKSALNLLTQQRGELFAPQGKGPQLLQYLEAIIATLEDNYAIQTGETNALKQNINHIAEIVSSQQKFAGRQGIIETINITKLIEEALSINAVSLENNQVDIVRQYDPVIEITSERSKIVQILVNLIRNANEAMAMKQITRRILTIKAQLAEQRLTVIITDSGIGISQSQMKRLFSFGYTTKADGHGFGLHSCALAARQMQGKLTAQSQGEQQGASFILTLPQAASPRNPNNDTENFDD